MVEWMESVSDAINAVEGMECNKRQVVAKVACFVTRLAREESKL